MRFYPYGTYTHPRMMDCVILVKKAYRIKLYDYSLRVEWHKRTGESLRLIETLRVRDSRSWIQIRLPYAP